MASSASRSAAAPPPLAPATRCEAADGGPSAHERLSALALALGLQLRRLDANVSRLGFALGELGQRSEALERRVTGDARGAARLVDAAREVDAGAEQQRVEELSGALDKLLSSNLDLSREVAQYRAALASIVDSHPAPRAPADDAADDPPTPRDSDATGE